MAIFPTQTPRYADLAAIAYIDFLMSPYPYQYNLKVHEVKGPIITLEFWTDTDTSPVMIFSLGHILVQALVEVIRVYTVRALVTSEYLGPDHFASRSHGSIIVTAILGQHPLESTLN